jgi:hypothetical protein
MTQRSTNEQVQNPQVYVQSVVKQLSSAGSCDYLSYGWTLIELAQIIIITLVF